MLMPTYTHASTIMITDHIILFWYKIVLARIWPQETRHKCTPFDHLPKCVSSPPHHTYRQYYIQHAYVIHWHGNVIWENNFIQITTFLFQCNMVNLRMKTRYKVSFVSLKYSKFAKTVIVVVHTLSWSIGPRHKGIIKNYIKKNMGSVYDNPRILKNTSLLPPRTYFDFRLTKRLCYNIIRYYYTNIGSDQQWLIKAVSDSVNTVALTIRYT